MAPKQAAAPALDPELVKDARHLAELRRKPLGSDPVKPAIVKEVCDLMRKHSEQPLLQEHGCAVLRNMACNLRNLTSLFSAGAVTTILSTMTAMPTQPFVLEQACGALSNLARGDASAAVNITSAGALALIMAAMKEHPKKANVQEQACAALWNLSGKSAIIQTEVAELGLMDVIITGMRTHKTNAGVQESGCGALCNIVSRSAKNKELLAQSSGAAVICTAMDAHVKNEKVQHQGCAALWGLSAASTAGRDDATGAGGLRRVCQALKTHLEVRQVQESGCGALRAITAFNQENKITAARHGAVEHLCEILGGDSRGQRSLQRQALGALLNLTAGSIEAQKVMVFCAGIDTLGTVLSNIKNEPGLVEITCGVLRNVAAGGPEVCATLLEASPGSKSYETVAKHIFASIFRAMSLQEDNPLVMRECFDGIRFLCEWRIASVFDDFKLDDVRRICQTMKYQNLDQWVLQRGCVLLQALCAFPPLRKHVLNAGALQAVASTMSTHVSSSMLQTAGCSALVILMEVAARAKIEQHMRKIEDLKIFELVMTALQNFENHLGVQEESMRALRLLIYNEKILQLALKTGFLQSILHTMDEYPNSQIIQTEGAYMLEALLVNRSCQQMVMSEGGVQHLVTAMKENIDSAPIVLAVLYACASALRASEDIVHAASDGQIDQVVFEIMRAHPDNEELQRQALAVLRLVPIRQDGVVIEDPGDDTELQAKALQAAALQASYAECIVKATESYLKNSPLQRDGMQVLCNIVLRRPPENLKLEAEAQSAQAADSHTATKKQAKAKNKGRLIMDVKKTDSAASPASPASPGTIASPKGSPLLKEQSSALFGLGSPAASSRGDSSRSAGSYASSKGSAKSPKGVSPKSRSAWLPTCLTQEQKTVCSKLVERICAGMEALPGNPEIQREGCRCLEVLAKQGPDVDSIIVTYNALSHVCQALCSHVDNLEVQRDACGAIAAVVANQEDQKKQAAEAGVVKQICTSMANYSTDRGVQLHGLLALWSLSTKCMAIKYEIYDLSGVDLVVNAIKYYPDDGQVTVSALGTMAALVGNCSVIQQSALEAGFLDMVLKVMESSTEDNIQLRCFAMLAALVYKSPHFVCSSEAIIGTMIDTVGRGMQRYLRNLGLQLAACRLLKRLAAQSEEARHLILSAHSFKRVLTAMHTYRINPHLQRQACELIRNLVVGDKALQKMAANAGAVEKVLAALSFHHASMIVQKQAFSALGNLAFRSVTIKKRLAVGSGVTVIFTSMDANSTDLSLQLLGCWTLNILLEDNARCVRKFTEVGGLDRIKTLLSRFPHNEQVQKMVAAVVARVTIYNNTMQDRPDEQDSAEEGMDKMDSMGEEALAEALALAKAKKKADMKAERRDYGSLL